MGFLIRTTFWLGLVLLLIPIGGATKDHAAVSPIQAFLAAREAVTDLAGMCDRKPDVCATGQATLQTIGMRAKAGARIAYGLLDETDDTATATASTDTAMATGSIARAD